MIGAWRGLNGFFQDKAIAPILLPDKERWNNRSACFQTKKSRTGRNPKGFTEEGHLQSMVKEIPITHQRQDTVFPENCQGGFQKDSLVVRLNRDSGHPHACTLMDKEGIDAGVTMNQDGSMDWKTVERKNCAGQLKITQMSRQTDCASAFPQSSLHLVQSLNRNFPADLFHRQLIKPEKINKVAAEIPKNLSDLSLRNLLHA